jgi:hypothetical protein
MEFTMNTITRVAVLVASFAVSAAEAETSADPCPLLDEVVVDGSAVQLPSDVAEHVTMLLGHGERFARAVDLIIEENAKPHWAHMIECTAAAVTTAVPAVRRSDATPWFIGREPALEPATSGAADDRLAVLFDVKELRGIQPALLRLWYSSVIADPMTVATMDHASEVGIEAILKGLFQSGAADRIVVTLDTDSARPLFAVLFHPLFLKALVEDTEARRAAWSNTVDALEELYQGEP